MAKVLMVHGYMLSGTGSNLYVRNIVKQMCEMGQDVILVCQEFTPSDYDFVSKHLKAQGDEYEVLFERETAYPGTCELYTPDTEGELLVYVYDRYGELKVREMKEASPAEIDRYIALNAKTIQHICENNDISVAYSNHLVLQPQYVAAGILAAGADIHQVIIGHGSDLLYAISQSKYLDALSRASLESCDQLVAVSQSLKESMQHYYSYLDLSACRVINPGLDGAVYGDMPMHDEQTLLEAYIDKADQGLGFGAEQSKMIAHLIEQDSFGLSEVQASYEAKAIEVGIADKLFTMMYDEDNEKVIYLGKYLEQKGLIPLVLGLPLLYAHNPQINYILIGYGELRAVLEYLIQLIEQGKVDEIFEHAKDLGIELDVDLRAIEELRHYLSDPKNRSLYQKGARLLSTNTLFTGYLDQDFAIRVLHSGRVAVFPSLTAEAFGMVIIEAMAAKTKPLCTRHSGFEETLQTAASHIPHMDVDDFSVPVDKHLLFNLVDKTLTLLDDHDQTMVDAMSTFALNNYGWRGIAKQLLEL